MSLRVLVSNKKDFQEGGAVGKDIERTQAKDKEKKLQFFMK